jgi:hypothetical protein
VIAFDCSAVFAPAITGTIVLNSCDTLANHIVYFNQNVYCS